MDGGRIISLSTTVPAGLYSLYVAVTYHCVAHYHYNVKIDREIVDSNYSGWKWNTTQAYTDPSLLDWTENFDYWPSGHYVSRDHPSGMLPTITGQASNRQHYVGDNVELKAGLHEYPMGVGVVYGMSYKWFKNDEPMAVNFHPDSGTLSLPNIQLSDSGEYHVRITNWYGETISSKVTISVSN